MPSLKLLPLTLHHILLFLASLNAVDGVLYGRHSLFPLESNGLQSRFLSNHAGSHVYHKPQLPLTRVLFPGMKQLTRMNPLPTKLLLSLTILTVLVQALYQFASSVHSLQSWLSVQLAHPPRILNHQPL